MDLLLTSRKTSETERMRRNTACANQPGPEGIQCVQQAPVSLHHHAALNEYDNWQMKSAFRLFLFAPKLLKHQKSADISQSYTKNDLIKKYYCKR